MFAALQPPGRAILKAVAMQQYGTHLEDHAQRRQAQAPGSPWPLWRRRTGTMAAGALATAMAYGVVFGHNGLTAFARKRAEARTLEQQTMQLEQENERLRGHVERLQTDPDEIEHEARANLRYARPDEVIVTVPTAPAATSSR
jgi:cell division protein FtsB